VYPLADSATALEVSQFPSWSIEPEMNIFSPYEVATRSLKTTGSAVEGAQVPVEVEDTVGVARLEVAEPPHSPLPDTQADGTSTRGRPDDIGTGRLPFGST
jgi:hypothetical protein